MARAATDSHLSDDAIDAGRERGRTRYELVPRILSASYDAKRDRIVVELNTGHAVAIPRRLLQGLENATAHQLPNVRVMGPGTAIAWRTPDVGFSVEGLLNGVYGTRHWMSRLGHLAGAKTSPRKAAAARANGAKGGRPRKLSAD